jgi:hypothetical protein
MVSELSFSADAEEKRFSFRPIISGIKKIGNIAGKVSDITGKVAIIASVL